MLLRRALHARSLARCAPAASYVQPQQSAQRPWCTKPPDAYTPLIVAACQTVRQIAHVAPLAVAPAAAFASTPNGTEAINTALLGGAAAIGAVGLAAGTASVLTDDATPEAQSGARTLCWAEAAASLRAGVFLLDIAQRKPGTNHVNYDVTTDAFGTTLVKEHDLIKQRNEYERCPLTAKEINKLFRYFVNKGDKYDSTGALWRKTLSIQLGAGIDGGLRGDIGRQLKQWLDATDRGKIPDAISRKERKICSLGEPFFLWLQRVQAQAIQIDGLHISHIHVQIYGWDEKPFTGTCHADLRLWANEPDDVGRILLPAADCYDRPLLFIAANGRLNGNGSLFKFLWDQARIVGVAFGALKMNAVGCGALPLLPAHNADLSSQANHSAARAVHLLHGAFMVGPGSAVERGTDEIAATVVLSGHTK